MPGMPGAGVVVVVVSPGGVIVVVAPLGAFTVALGAVTLVVDPVGAVMVAPGVVTVVELPGLVVVVSVLLPVSAFAAVHPSATKLNAINESFLMTPLPNTLLSGRAPMWVPTVDLTIAQRPTSEPARP
jgi:hypothetical protein